ncbi:MULTISPECIES: asparagine synthase (glutamine-hydrolyzing) [unclassified Streptomyces]|uniref:asparagine synthase (glutamine-hydrolyzing) n=1 Tax=unclassified Streptomyces TaxID=2593676 RepID=UPI00081B1CAE|nr:MULTISPECIES: asparagine synthase (glutamine-hydrolyzing) [unclassified Streptomyces]MYQ87043.1 asparagine synthase (glutamine-hydrolyzing) [Streptomyces sp. SID4936]SCE40063.1 asparagine synthase (glutamine-hydrolysing) [Streptomyces sp. DvalAA-43]
MCGIAGWVDRDRDLRTEARTVRAMTDTMVLRGPDAGDVWLSEHAALGHRRLAVIDIEGGSQPMEARDGDGRVLAAITYSGEVYNFRELRAELTALGHRFRTGSDTEVVLRAHLQWGEAAVPRLTGMFAYAVWDVSRQELLLVRDRLGVKPLYWTAGDRHLLFGSEPKAVLANPLFTAETDAEGLAELFAVPSAPTPGHTVFRGLRTVRPGHTVRFGPAGVSERAYWTLETRPHTDDLDTTAARVRELLTDAVQRQLVSDVPLGLLLSGGLDSSTLTALAADDADGDKVATFSVDFPPDEQPERLGDWNRDSDAPYIQELADRLATTHTAVTVPGSELLAHRSIGLQARDRPGWGEPDVSLYLLFKGVRRHVTVALSGEVADEVFGGYPYFHHDRPLDTFPWLGGGPSPAGLLRPDVAEWVRPGEYAARRFGEALAEVPHLEGESGQERRARQISYLALTRWLPALLDRKDRMSMAASLEVRVPFADHRLVEYLWNVPWSQKNAGGVPKGLLRRAVGDLLPASVLHRPKSGYPASSAPGYGRTLRALAEDLVQRNGPVFDLVDRDAVKRHLAAGTPLPGPRAAPHPTGGLDHLLAVDRWLDTYGVRVR